MAQVSTQGVSAMAMHTSETEIPSSLSQGTIMSVRSSSLSADNTAPRSPSLHDNAAPSVNSPTRPTPLPAFTFPMKAPAPSAAPRSAPASFSRASGRRPMSAIELNGPTDFSLAPADGGRPRLPEFSFGGSPAQTPPLSPRDIPSRSGFHKRGTSEFIGGDGKTGKGGLMSTSPTKGDNTLPPPSATTFGPPAGRRGHAHRRSAAMSCHDLSMILKPDTAMSKGGASAPTSPSTEEHRTGSFSNTLDSTVQSATDENNANPDADTAASSRPLNRVRVAFSDNVETIPRPLSVVSSDSASTVRQGHSVSNSMSSIISGGASSPQSKLNREVAPSPWAPSTSRPRTAEPFDEISPTSEVPRRRNSNPMLSDVASAISPALSTPRSSKKWGFFGNENGETSPRSRPTSAASAEKGSRGYYSDDSTGLSETVPVKNVLHTTESASSRRSSVSRKPTKKQKKVRSWAGSMLSRKSRQRTQKQKLNRRSPTPPLRAYTDEQHSLTSTEPQREPDQYFPSSPESHVDYAAWKPRQLPVQEEASSPMIDLDAALGPFNTPTSPRFGEDWELAQKGGLKKRTMHSAASTSYLHRRAESAPEFENPRFGLHRLGSNSTMGMEDVFEEEEEDEDWEDTKTSDKGSVLKSTGDDESTGLGIDIKVVDSDSVHGDKSMDFEDAAFLRGIKRKGSGLSENDRRIISSTKSEHSNRSIIDEPIAEEPSTIEFADDSMLPGSDTVSKSSDSTATPPLRPAAKELAPIDLYSYSLQAPYPTPNSPRSATQSSFPSPRSPFSYDTQRMSTAPSSVNDEHNFQSLLLGEPGPEVRPSVDDVPSLTSSDSTMTKDGPIPQAINNFQFREGQRSSSMSSAAISRKRSSMASLSRLISSSHGEKSKPGTESRPSTAAGIPEKKEKTSRGKRISRLMQFWKPKEP